MPCRSWRVHAGAAAGALVLAGWAVPLDAATRFTFTITGNRILTIDNASQMSRDWVINLVSAADRSLREDCPFDPPDAIGFFRPADRIVVTDNYLAWFDYTADSYPTGNWTRTGELSGFWTLDPANHFFRYLRPNSCGTNNWPHNELAVGSASPAGQLWWWDRYAPPVEHVVHVQTPDFFGAMHYAGTSATRVLDGLSLSDGVHYKVAGRLANPAGATTFLTNGSTNWIDAEVEYVARPRDIVSVWKFKPANASVTVRNVFTYVWSAYSMDEDGFLPCDQSPADDYPGTYYGMPLFGVSSLSLITNWNGFFYPAGTVAPMSLGPVCNLTPTGGHINRDMYTPDDPGDGDWIAWGEASDLSTAEVPAMTLTVLGAPGSGSGTQASPLRFAWDALLFANESFDGILGAGAFNQNEQVLQGGTWYGDTFTLHSHFGAGNARGDFDHDGKSDLFWRNQATQKLEVWTMDGVTQVDTRVPVPDQAAHANWKVVGTADFDNDGKNDLLWYNLTSTKIVVWMMDNDLNRISGTFTNPSEVAGGAGWVAVGNADFDRDGRPDIVWRNSSTGKFVIWTMTLVNGVPTRVTGAFTTPDGAPLDTQIEAVDDLNSDGYADLVLRSGTNGAVTLWQMGANFARTQSIALGNEADLGWKIVGSGYFNEDQSVDLLWRHDDGRLRVWLMNLTSVAYSVPLDPDQRFDTNWKVAGPH